MKPFDKRKITEIKDDIFFSFIFLTIIPFLRNGHNRNYKKLDFTKAQWAFPLVGIFLGFISLIIIKVSIFLGLNLLVSSTFAVISNIFFLGLMHHNNFINKRDQKLNLDSFNLHQSEIKNPMPLILLIFLKINVLSELITLKSFSLMIIGCCGLGILSMVYLRKISFIFINEKFSNIVGKPSYKNLLISTLIVIIFFLPLGLVITLILLTSMIVTVYIINKLLLEFKNETKINSIIFYTQVVEIISLIILNIWFKS